MKNKTETISPPDPPPFNYARLELLCTDFPQTSSGHTPGSGWDLYKMEDPSGIAVLFLYCPATNELKIHDGDQSLTQWRAYNPQVDETALPSTLLAARSIARQVLQLSQKEGIEKFHHHLLIRGPNQTTPRPGEIFVFVPCAEAVFSPPSSFEDDDGQIWEGFLACCHLGENDNRGTGLFDLDPYAGPLPYVAVVAVSNYDEWHTSNALVWIAPDEFQRTVMVVPRTHIRHLFPEYI